MTSTVEFTATLTQERNHARSFGGVLPSRHLRSSGRLLIHPPVPFAGHDNNQGADQTENKEPDAGAGPSECALRRAPDRADLCAGRRIH